MGKMHEYLNSLHNILTQAEVTDANRERVDTTTAINKIIVMLEDVRDARAKNIFIGNGGSAAIASHMAIDYSKNGRLPSLAFNDGAALTCLGNDLGFERVFSEQVKLHSRPGDLVFAISSSGASPNILAAVRQAQESDCHVVTLSGFSPENPLRQEGLLNWYVNSYEYGFVELSHFFICHLILDYQMGWRP